MKSKRNMYTIWIKYWGDAGVLLGRAQVKYTAGRLIICGKEAIVIEKEYISNSTEHLLKKIYKCRMKEHNYLCTYDVRRRISIFENML